MGNPESAVDQIKEESSSDRPKFNDRRVILSFLAFCLLTALIYLLPTYVIIEWITRDGVFLILSVLAFPVSLATELLNPNIPFDAQMNWQVLMNQGFISGWPGLFPEAVPEVAGIYMPQTPLMLEGDYRIVKACTGMQAGAVLLALILVTPAPWRNKFSALSTLITILTLTNVVRIAFHLTLVNYGIEFFWAHDVLSKPIGFVGSLIWAYVIEKQGVPIIDQFAEWMEWSWERIRYPGRTKADLTAIKMNRQNRSALLLVGFMALGIIIFMATHTIIVTVFMYQPDLNVLWGRTLYGYLYRLAIELPSTILYLGLFFIGGGIGIVSLTRWITGFVRQPVKVPESTPTVSENPSSSIPNVE